MKYIIYDILYIRAYTEFDNILDLWVLLISGVICPLHGVAA